MSQRFYQGEINHLTWVAVDKTDFATPESALSGATTIKIYGTLNGNSTAQFFVISGTGSLAASGRDITHVGASATGIYTIALGGAQLSDASAAFYDTYIVHLSDTGGSSARQTLIVPGIRRGSSWFSNVSGVLSDVYSLLSDHHSDFQSRVPKLVANNSQLSDLASDLRSYLVVMSGMLSDTYSAAVVAQNLTASDLSDIRSAIAAGPAATVTASDISDIASAVRAAMVSDLSDILSAAVQTNSRVLLVQSRLSDFNSAYSSDISDIRSMLTYLSDAASNIYSATLLTQSLASDAYSAAVAITATISASDISDIVSAVRANLASDLSDILSSARIAASAASDAASGITVLQSRVGQAVATASDVASKVWAEKYTTASNVKASTFGSMMRLNMSRISDTQSYLVGISGMLSDVYSLVGTGTSASKISSKVWSDFQSRVGATPSDQYSLILLMASRVSDIQSYLIAMSGMLSDAHSAAILAASNASEAQSNALLIQSRLSDFNSAYLSDISDIRSMLTALSGMISDVDSALTSQYSDIASKIGAVSVTITASDISDIASAVVAGLPITSAVSDIYSMLSDFYSEFQSRVPKAVATASYLTAVSGMLSDTHSAATLAAARGSQATSQALLASSRASDAHSATLIVQSLLSDLSSRLASDVSDILSMVTGLSGTLSDVDSALTSQFSALTSDATAIKSRVLVNQSAISDIYSRLITARSEPAQGNPPVSTDALTKLDYLYKSWRNKKLNDGSQNKLYADDGTTVDQKQTTTAAGGSVTVAEWVTGP